MQTITKAPAKITRATIETAWRQRRDDQRHIIRDKECRGLMLTVHPTTMTWGYTYQARGTDAHGKRWPNRTVTIGNPETHSPADARVAANKLKGEVKAGKDPVAEHKAAAEEEQRKRGATLGKLADEYEQALARRPKLRGEAGTLSARYAAEEAQQVRLALEDIDAEDKPAMELAEADIRRLLALQDNNPRARFGALSRFLDWCHDAGHVTANPCALLARTRRPKAPQARAHYLARRAGPALAGF